MTVPLDTLLETAAEGARRAGRILREKFREPRTISFKGGIDFDLALVLETLASSRLQQEQRTAS